MSHFAYTRMLSWLSLVNIEFSTCRTLFGKRHAPWFRFLSKSEEATRKLLRPNHRLPSRSYLRQLMIQEDLRELFWAQCRTEHLDGDGGG
jgi:hypothetical protein